mmetsp:Transcript_16707/g.27712  ORF Transcript_16707/g.27712 Transcript_16707/m.27712 type:complete len:234 (+) Transcript_16707:513-1214(+)
MPRPKTCASPIATAAPTPTAPKRFACSTSRMSSCSANDGLVGAGEALSSLVTSLSSSASSTAVSHRSGGESPAASSSSANAKRMPPSARERCAAAALRAGDKIIATTREIAGDALSSSTSPLTRARSYALALSDSRTISLHVPAALKRARVAMTRSQRGAISSGVIFRKRRRTCSSPFSKSSTARPSVSIRSDVAARDCLPDGNMPSSSPDAHAALTSSICSGVCHFAECARQ